MTLNKKIEKTYGKEIPYFGLFSDLVRIDNGKGEMKKGYMCKGTYKQGLPCPIGWQETTILNYKEKIKNSFTSYGIPTGENSNLFVIDFDNVPQYEKYVEKYPDLLETLRIKTQNGYHLYFEYDERLKFKNTAMKSIEIDFRSNGNFIIGCGSKIDGKDCYKNDNKKKIQKIDIIIVEDIEREFNETNDNLKNKKIYDNNNEQKNNIQNENDGELSKAEQLLYLFFVF